MYVGGVRIRMIQDNMMRYIEQGLDDLGWFSSGRNHAPIDVRSDPVDWDVEALPNIVSVTIDHSDEMESELGSNLTENRWDFYVDVYCEKESLAIHLTTDIRDLLRGKFSSIGFSQPVLHVFDLTQATPSLIFTCDIEDLSMDKNRFANKPYQSSWWVISFVVVDEYGNQDSL